jgi:hypothetical protein
MTRLGGFGRESLRAPVSVPVPDTLAALHVNPETGLTHAEVDTRHAAILAVAGAHFAMALAVG